MRRVRTMEDRLYRVAQAMLWREADCLDAVQEAVFRGWMKKDRLSDPDRFEPWLMRILANQCRDMLRRRRRAPVALETDVGREDHLCEDLHLRLALRQLPEKLPAAAGAASRGGLSPGGRGRGAGHSQKAGDVAIAPGAGRTQEAVGRRRWSMKRRGMDSRLERAFTQAPPELSDRIELAFLRGEQAMKKRHKLMVSLSVAAALAMLILGIALAAGEMTRPRQDAVVAAVDGAEGIAAESTPTPVPATEPEYTPTPMPEPAQGKDLTAEICYATAQGEYFHRYENCSGMLDAIPWTQAAALAMGKQPCPVCLPANASAAPTVSPMPCEQDGVTVYYSDRDAYYHGSYEIWNSVNGLNMG